MTVATAQAAPATSAGEQVGLTAGYPLPTGIVVAVDTFTAGRADRPNAPDVMGNIPFVVWASPYRLFGGQIQPVVSFPTALIGTRNPAPLPNRDVSAMYNPLLASALAWDLGNGLGVSYLLGAYLPVSDRGSLASASTARRSCRRPPRRPSARASRRPMSATATTISRRRSPTA
ncbi:transporter [Methylorubrum rhodesianum]|nr:transporter [Methylorubrum rhodesianum]